MKKEEINVKIKSFKINKNEPEMEKQHPYLLVELNGNGCSIKECMCSPPNFISVSDGKKGFEVTLTDEEAKRLKKSGKLDIEKVQ